MRRQSKVGASFRGLMLLAVAVGLPLMAGLVVGARNATVNPPPSVKPISEVRLGERVLGQNPELSGKDADLPEPQADTWRQVRLQLQTTHSPQVDVELLRPLSWLEAVGARAGGTIHLELPELGAVGPATVLSIEPCPTLMPGRGNLVTGRFVHRPSGDLLELYVRGEPSPLRVTPNHPIWSVDRVEFVTAGELRQGEVLLTRHRGQVQVERIVRRACHEPVYNLEVFGQHVYEVGTTGLLVHNSYECGQDPVNPPHEPAPTDPVKAPVAGTSAPEPPAGSAAEARTTAPVEAGSNFTGRFARVNPNEIGFSQRTAGGSGRAAPLRESMAGGWNGPAIDAVQTPNGLVTIDNTRVAIAQELGISQIPVKVRLPSDPLPPSMLGRFGSAKTWGEALIQRTGNQRPPLPPGGTMTRPRLPK